MIATGMSGRPKSLVQLGLEPRILSPRHLCMTPHGRMARAQEGTDVDFGIGSRAKMANGALAPLSRLIGSWKVVGTHPAVPDTTLRGRASFEWNEGGAFIMWRSQIDDDRFPDGLAIFGSDDEAGTVFLSYFDERGVSRKYDVTIEDAGISLERLNPKFSQHMHLTIDPGGERIVSRGRFCRDAASWEDDLSLIYARAALRS